MRKRVVVGVSGASGGIYAIRLLKLLKQIASIETHLIMTDSAQRSMSLEMSDVKYALADMADIIYDINDIAAAIASGSYETAGMIVVPCSIKTLSGIAHSYSDNLLIRAADVTLKERRPLVLSVRETPLHLGHLRLMTTACEQGAIIMPPLNAFYHQPKTIDDLIDNSVRRMLQQLKLDIEIPNYQSWSGG
ncbi:UbiX family flavin prenyltransferase [Utexia brackfieldae]|uniref:UbiX family flavin prenyltransferase n=1 Tax=Utexia brackfieldae TaxID=3074108 RepID=UPI00370D1774